MEDTKDDARGSKENIENICIYKDDFSGGSKKNIENACIYKDNFLQEKLIGAVRFLLNPISFSIFSIYFGKILLFV